MTPMQRLQEAVKRLESASTFDVAGQRQAAMDALKAIQIALIELGAE